jgi:hypothetical protein
MSYKHRSFVPAAFHRSLLALLQFEAGGLDVKGTNPHLPAGLLKQWIRALTEPVIPQEMYAEVGQGSRVLFAVLCVFKSCWC